MTDGVAPGLVSLGVHRAAWVSTDSHEFEAMSL